VKRSGHGGRVFYGALAIGTLGEWELSLTPNGWMLDAEAQISRYWCDPKPPHLRVELVKMVPADNAPRGTEDPPLVETATTHYGIPARIRPHDLLLKDVNEQPPSPAAIPDNAG
jgi:hypothetical protein